MAFETAAPPEHGPPLPAGRLWHLLCPARALRAAGMPFTGLLASPPSALAASLAINLIGLALPVAILQVYDRIVPKQAVATLDMLALALVLVLLLEFALKAARAHLLSWSAARFAHNIACDGIRRLLAAPEAALPREPAARTAERIEAMARLAGHLGGAARQVAVDLPFALLFFAAIWLIGGWLVLAPAALVLVFALAVLAEGARLRRAAAARRAHEIAMAGRWGELFRNIRSVKAHAMERLMLRRLEPLAARSAETHAALAEAAERGQILGALLGSCTTLGVVVCGALAAAAGELTVGQVAACSMLAGRAVQPVLRLAALWSEHQSFRLALESASGIFALPPAPEPARSRVAGPPEVVLPARATARIGPDGEGPLTPVEAATVPAGGAARLRFHRRRARAAFLQGLIGRDPAGAGGIRIDGMAPEAYRAAHDGAICLIGRDLALFDGTLHGNMTFFGRRASFDRAAAMARLLGLREDVLQMPDGFESRLRGDAPGAHPRRLVQGAALTRMLAGHPALLVLDDTLDALEPALAERLTEALRDLRGSATVLIVSDHPAAARLAEAVIHVA
ncbi:hypothetical protein LNKW23_12260 [Paralimibaculum aggregatum]|uniref:ABC transmembrane type-1 domain-containing protein n=1 Tax=Paralimibaculum aggregatum TaxID=3036245 RepID=A0ABQ6LMF2_9RHOB|nr:ABC transporter transmembrane domain-containing protein [Limibaculum sp. NKW23]GMG82013.1 hypothetical protein LNKW23_12260 [Limibaculum sp. NKW23]